jgi:hypothetical protein
MHKRKLTVGGVVGMIVLGSLMIALMIYTATRTIDFIQMTFPKSMSYVAYLALAAFDGGILGWTIFATFSAEGALQRGLAYLMIFVDTLGVILTTVADTTTVSAQNGLTKLDPNMATVGMWGSIAIIVLNVVAIIVTHLVSPEHMRKFELENVHDSIHQLTMQHIRTRAIEIAPQIAAEHAEHWVRTTIQDVVGSLPASSQTRQIAAPRIIDADRSVLVETEEEQVPVSSRTQTLDPTNVREKIDTEKKSFKDKIKGALNFSTPEKAIVEDFATDNQPVKRTHKIQDDDPLADDYADPMEEEVEKDNPANWNLVDWRTYRNKVDAWSFEKVWQEYHGDIPFPDDRTKIATKKSASAKKKVSRREVLGMEKQEE